MKTLFKMLSDIKKRLVKFLRRLAVSKFASHDNV